MNFVIRTFAARLVIVCLCVAAAMHPPAAHAYSVLSHEEVVDMAWKTNIVPMLKARFPGISEDEIRQAHAYAYGGSVIQDLGYYPFGSHYFSDLLHYVRPQDFVEALIRDSTTPNEYAFALGALAHFCGDIIGHPAINKIVPQENEQLNSRFGRIVTYAEDPLQHIRTEFGFDVVEVAHGHYSQLNYRDFVGFQVSKSLLNQAFQETYGIPVSDVLKHEDLAIGSYRRAVSSLIPKMTNIAFVSYKDQIVQATPGIDKRRFMYRLNQTEYNKNFGTDYYHLGVRARITAFILRFLPKIGPLKSLKVTLPDAQEQATYLKSMNDSVDRYKLYLAQIHAAPAPLPVPDPKDAADARKAVSKIDKDAASAQQQAERAQDPAEKAKLEQAAANAEKNVVKATAAADRTQARVDAAQAASDSGDPGDAQLPAHALPTGTPIKPPTEPKLPGLDLDTGQPTTAGEYFLADRTYAHLLDELVHAHAAAPVAASPKPEVGAQLAGSPVPTQPASPAPIDPKLAAEVERFFAHPIAHKGPAMSAKDAEKAAAMNRQIQADLASLKAMGSEPAK